MEAFLEAWLAGARLTEIAHLQKVLRHLREIALRAA